MKKFIILFAILYCGHLSAQVMGNYYYSNNGSQPYHDPRVSAPISITQANPNELNFQVNGLINIVADNYVAVFNIVQVGETADSTEFMMNARIKQFQNTLKEIGIEESAIKIDMLSFVPKFGLEPEHRFSKTYNEVPAGYELQKNVLIRYRNSSKLDDIISAAARAEIYDLIKVDYFVSNMEKYADSLRTKCIQELKQKGKIYESMGFRLDTLKKTMNDNLATIYPDTRYFTYQAYSRPSMGAVKRKNNPTIVEAEKATSRFYSAVDAQQYDVVINPIVNEPVIQLSYSVYMKYILKDSDPPANRYFVLGQNGESRQLQIN